MRVAIPSCLSNRLGWSALRLPQSSRFFARRIQRPGVSSSSPTRILKPGGTSINYGPSFDQKLTDESVRLLTLFLHSVNTAAQ